MKNNLKSAINRYLRSKDELAFQIDGPWGSGKTYFVKNNLKEIFKNTQYTPVYVSLNGVSEIGEVKKEINRQVLAAILQMKGDKYSLTSKANSIFNMIDEANLSSEAFGSWINDALSTAKLLKNQTKKSLLKKADLSKFVLITDEFERIEKFSLIPTILGYASNLQNNWNCKLLIVSYEAALTSKNGYDNFKVAKEKFINKSWLFGKDTKENALQIIDQYLKGQAGVTDRLYHWIANISSNVLDLLDSINLRTLKSILSTYCQVVNELVDSTLNAKERDQVLKTSYLSIFVITDLVKRGKLSKLTSIDVLFNLSSDQIRFNKSGLLNKATEDETADQNDISNIVNTFHGKYRDFDDNMLYLSSIKELVLHDSLDIEGLITSINNIFLPTIPEHQRLMEKARNFRTMSQTDLKNVEERLLNSIQGEDIAYKELFDIYNIMNYFKKIDLLFIDVHFPELMERILHKIQQMTYDEVRIGGYLSLDNTEDPNTLKTIREALKKREKKTLIDNDKQGAEYLLNGQILKFRKKGSYFYKNSLFQIMLQNQIIKKFVSWDDNAFGGLQYYLVEEIIHVKNAANIHQHELKYMEEFLKLLENKTANPFLDKVIKFRVKELMGTIKQAYKVLSVTGTK